MLDILTLFLDGCLDLIVRSPLLQISVKEDGTLANDQYYAISLIMKGLYYQLFTDTFGMIPFSEASNPDIVTPVFDTQKDIYKGIISDLDQAIGLNRK